MSKKPKHVYTCPDVIYLREKSKRHNRNTLIGVTAAYAALFATGWIGTKVAERRENAAGDTNNVTNLMDYPEQG